MFDQFDPYYRWLGIAKTGRLFRRFRVQDDMFFDVAYSPDGRRVAAGGERHSVYVWDLASNRMVTQLAAHTDTIHDIEYLPDPRGIATAGDDRVIRLLRVPD